MEYKPQSKKPQCAHTTSKQCCYESVLALVSQTITSLPSQLMCRHRRYQLMKSGKRVLQTAATHPEDTHPTNSSSIYSQALQCSPYELDYNPYNTLDVTEQYKAWSTAASTPIITALQRIPVIDSTEIVPQAYPLTTPQQVLVPTQGPVCSQYTTRKCKSQRLYKEQCIHEHGNCNNNQGETDGNVSCINATQIEECLNKSMLENTEILNNTTNSNTEENEEKKQEDTLKKGDLEAALNEYFKLPEDLFHCPRKLNIMDPNEIIDEICLEKMSSQDFMWLLDLELGHPKKSTSNFFATYDVQNNVIVSTDLPTTMHPGFAKCSEKFRKTLLFYYDSIISSWYLGFATYYGDYSVTRFQEWLTKVMNAYGMSWR